ncbi:MAG: HAD family hydrolase [Gloeomargaritaceae cyanobacterium C42_A2020_066]|nr:HAD family hydrolase [Gloeomargaritaceae cyanobacterium C42_A2020_066]
MLRIITDFDGPLVDVSERYYQVYRFCLAQIGRPEQAITCLDKSTFWALKRARVPETEVGRRSGLSEEQARVFSQLRQATVHTHPYFEFDQLQPGVIALLGHLRDQGIDLAVLTMRRQSELAFALNQFGLGELFTEERRFCLPEPYQKTRDDLDKPLLMAQALQILPPAATTWMVGDTEADLVAAQIHGLPVVAVLNGIRDRERLATYQPVQIVDDLEAAVTWIAAVMGEALAQKTGDQPQAQEDCQAGEAVLG